MHLRVLQKRHSFSFLVDNSMAMPYNIIIREGEKIMKDIKIGAIGKITLNNGKTVNVLVLENFERNIRLADPKKEYFRVLDIDNLANNVGNIARLRNTSLVFEKNEIVSFSSIRIEKDLRDLLNQLYKNIENILKKEQEIKKIQSEISEINGKALECAKQCVALQNEMTKEDFVNYIAKETRLANYETFDQWVIDFEPASCSSYNPNEKCVYLYKQKTICDKKENGQNVLTYVEYDGVTFMKTGYQDTNYFKSLCSKYGQKLVRDTDISFHCWANDMCNVYFVKTQVIKLKNGYKKEEADEIIRKILE